jgi:hypothetical protein
MDTDEKVDLFYWYENFTATPRYWANIADPHQCPYAFFNLEPKDKRVFITDFMDEFPFVAWLFQTQNCADFALIIQNDLLPGELDPQLYSLRTGPLSGYITGILFNDDVLMMDFKLRFGELICA